MASEQQASQKYPNYPPYDSIVVFYDGSTLKQNPSGYEKLAKVCPKCQFPIQIRICIRPCMHYLCYECYNFNRQECAYCSTVACQAIRINDNEPIYSCDIECYKVFSSAQQLKKHMDEHSVIKTIKAGL